MGGRSTATTCVIGSSIVCSPKRGLRHLRFDDLRHTYASLLIQNGESLAYVRDQLGRASIQLTVDTYGHLVLGANRQAVDRLDDAMERAPRTTGKEDVISP